MTFHEFSKIGMAIKTYYPKEKILPDENSIKLWHQALKDLDYRTVYLALLKWVSTEKWSPTIADLRSLAYEVQNGVMLTWSEGWDEAVGAIRRYGYMREEEALKSMSNITKEVVKRLGYYNLCASENPAVDRANFRMVFEQLSERKKKDAQVSPKVKEAIEIALNNNKKALEVKEK